MEHGSFSRVGTEGMTLRRLLAIDFIPSRRLRKTELIGYDSQVKAGLGIGLSVAEGGGKNVLVFGFPGTGIRTFPYTVAWKLKAKYRLPFSLFRLDCEDLLLGMTKEHMLGTLNQWEQKIQTRGPTVVQLDRPEALGLTYENFHGSRGLGLLWLSRFLRRRYDSAAIFCTTSYPMKMDVSLKRVFNIPIYLDLPDLKLIKRIVKHFLNRSDYENIAERLYMSLRKFGFQILSGEVVQACRKIRSVKNVDDLPTDEVVDLLESHISPCHRIKEVEEYKRSIAGLVSFSKEFAIPYWEKWVDDYGRSKGYGKLTK